MSINRFSGYYGDDELCTTDSFLMPTKHHNNNEPIRNFDNSGWKFTVCEDPFDEFGEDSLSRKKIEFNIHKFNSGFQKYYFKLNSDRLLDVSKMKLRELFLTVKKMHKESIKNKEKERIKKAESEVCDKIDFLKDF